MYRGITLFSTGYSNCKFRGYKFYNHSKNIRNSFSLSAHEYFSNHHCMHEDIDKLCTFIKYPMKIIKIKIFMIFLIRQTCYELKYFCGSLR